MMAFKDWLDKLPTERKEKLNIVRKKLDKCSKQRIVVAPIPNKGIGKTINERLKRAAL